MDNEALSGASFTWATSRVIKSQKNKPSIHQCTFGISTPNWVATANTAVAFNYIEKEVKEDKPMEAKYLQILGPPIAKLATPAPPSHRPAAPLSSTEVGSVAFISANTKHSWKAG